MNSNYVQLKKYLSNLDPQRITAGRELRGLTKKALATKLGKTPSAITQFESGKSGLDIETFGSLAMALGLPPVFFTTGDVLDVDFASCHFRANRSVSQSDRRKAFRHSVTVIELFQSLERQGVVFPKPQVPVETIEGYQPAQIEALAMDTRRFWNISDGPIVNMAKLLESQGVFVVLLPVECEKLHAFSFWAEDRPCVVVTKSVSASHMQFDYGHELAHLILHMDESAGDPECERVANHFSGAFLAPARTFKYDCPRSWNYTAFLELKKYWKISMQAALFRGRQLGILMESRYRWAMIDLGKRGQRTHEEGEFAKPLPSLLASALNLVKEDVTLQNLADDIRTTESELIEILQSQLVPQSIIDRMKRGDPVNPRPKISFISPK